MESYKKIYGDNTYVMEDTINTYLELYLDLLVAKDYDTSVLIQRDRRKVRKTLNSLEISDIADMAEKLLEPPKYFGIEEVTPLYLSLVKEATTTAILFHQCKTRVYSPQGEKYV